jgi:hypothetical protein
VNPESRDGSAVAGPSRIFLGSLLRIALGAPLAAALACAAQPNHPDPNLAEVWRDYRKLPEHRALAIAGNLRQDRWVSAASGGHANVPDAEAAALRECAKRRLHARAQAPCQLYAVGDEIVWPGP